MDRVTRCLHCGKRLVPVRSADGRTELKCVWCDQVDPMETETAKWSSRTHHFPSFERPLKALARSRPSEVMSRYSTSA
jgi:phage FluMu protein Com